MRLEGLLASPQQPPLSPAEAYGLRCPFNAPPPAPPDFKCSLQYRSELELASTQNSAHKEPKPPQQFASQGTYPASPHGHRSPTASRLCCRGTHQDQGSAEDVTRAAAGSAEGKGAPSPAGLAQAPPRLPLDLVPSSQLLPLIAPGPQEPLTQGLGQTYLTCVPAQS